MAKQIYIDENGNEVLVSGTITNAGNLPLGTDFSDPNSTAGAVKAIPVIKSVLLTGTITSDASDSATIGFRNTLANAVDLTTVTGYPTGKTILGYVIEDISYNSVSGGIGFILGTKLSVNTKISASYEFKVRVIYVD